MPEQAVFQQRFWRQLIVLDTLGMVLVWQLYPKAVIPFGLACLLGALNIGSLFFNASVPQKKLQSLFSLVRIVGMAYALVKIGHGNMTVLGLVMMGFLSYKILLVVEGLQQIIALQRQK